MKDVGSLSVLENCNVPWGLIGSPNFQIEVKAQRKRVVVNDQDGAMSW